MYKRQEPKSYQPDDVENYKYWVSEGVLNECEAVCWAVAVSYTHLDVYKRQAMDIVKNTDFESFWPNVDGYSITDDQYKLYEKGSYNDVDVYKRQASATACLFLILVRLLRTRNNGVWST